MIGISTLAPLSLPTTVIVACKDDFDPNNELTVVALKLIVEPITVLDKMLNQMGVSDYIKYNRFHHQIKQIE